LKGCKPWCEGPLYMLYFLGYDLLPYFQPWSLFHWSTKFSIATPNPFRKLNSSSSNSQWLVHMVTFNIFGLVTSANRVAKVSNTKHQIVMKWIQNQVQHQRLEVNSRIFPWTWAWTSYKFC
jgi:hypothetical protein